MVTFGCVDMLLNVDADESRLWNEKEQQINGNSGVFLLVYLNCRV